MSESRNLSKIQVRDFAKAKSIGKRVQKSGTKKTNGKRSNNFYFPQVDTDTLTQLYKKIPLQSVEPTRPDDIFEFYDEEEEKRKQKEEEQKEKEKELEDRTCLICYEIFRDPIEVLRHKREVHPTKRICRSAKEMAEILSLPPQKHCPVCNKEIRKYHYKSVYEAHVKTHNGSTVFNCSKCNVVFKRMDNLRSHEKRHIV